MTLTPARLAVLRAEAADRLATVAAGTVGPTGTGMLVPADEILALCDTADAPRRHCYLSTAQLTSLDNACKLIAEGLGGPPYLVGSVGERPDFRDVDVRSILPDDDWDALFDGRDQFWSLFCYTTSEWLSKATGLPVDYQAQRMTEANERYGGKPRNPLGMGGRLFAGGGDSR